MTHTTHFASFGPVLVIAAHLNSCCDVKRKNLKTRVNTKKTRKKRKKKLTNGRNDSFCVVWPVSVITAHPNSPSRLVHSNCRYITN